MSKTLFNLRIDIVTLERIRNIAKNKKITTSKYIREIIKENINNGYDLELKILAKDLVKSLRQPFAYIKPLKDNAIKERNNREILAQKLEEIFKLT